MGGKSHGTMSPFSSWLLQVPFMFSSEHLLCTMDYFRSAPTPFHMTLFFHPNLSSDNTSSRKASLTTLFNGACLPHHCTLLLFIVLTFSKVFYGFTSWMYCLPSQPIPEVCSIRQRPCSSVLNTESGQSKCLGNKR